MALPPSTLGVVQCPEPLCGRLRASPCCDTCVLTTGRYLTERLRENDVLAEAREMQRQKIENGESA